MQVTIDLTTTIDYRDNSIVINGEKHYRPTDMLVGMEQGLQEARLPYVAIDKRGQRTEGKGLGTCEFCTDPATSIHDMNYGDDVGTDRYFTCHECAT